MISTKVSEFQKVVEGEIPFTVLPYLLPKTDATFSPGAWRKEANCAWTLACTSPTYSVSCALYGNDHSVNKDRTKETLNLFLGSYVRKQNTTNGHGLRLGLPKSIASEKIESFHLQQSQDLSYFCWQIKDRSVQLYHFIVYLKVHSDQDFLDFNFALKPNDAENEMEFL